MSVDPHAQKSSDNHGCKHMRFFHFKLEILFLGKFGSKYQNCQLKFKFGMQTNLKMQNSMVMFTFSVFDLKYLFCANMVQKIKIVSLS